MQFDKPIKHENTSAVNILSTVTFRHVLHFTGHGSNSLLVLKMKKNVILWEKLSTATTETEIFFY